MTKRNQLLQGIEELIRISRAAGVAAEFKNSQKVLNHLQFSIDFGELLGETSYYYYSRAEERGEEIVGLPLCEERHRGRSLLLGAGYAIGVCIRL